MPEDLKLATGQLPVLGLLLDGKIGAFEVKIINKLIDNNIIPYSVKEIKNRTKKYKLGKGFEERFENN